MVWLRTLSPKQTDWMSKKLPKEKANVKRDKMGRTVLRKRKPG
jgi:hypothetical protein